MNLKSIFSEYDVYGVYNCCGIISFEYDLQVIGVGVWWNTLNVEEETDLKVFLLSSLYSNMLKKILKYRTRILFTSSNNINKKSF